MKKSKKLLSVFLAVVIVLSSLSAGFCSLAAQEDTKDEAVASLEADITSFYDAKYQNVIFKDTDANYAAANEAFDAICAKLKALSKDQKLELSVSNYAFVLYYLTEQVGRSEAGLTGTNGKIYGITTGIKSVTDKIGDFPKDYQDALDIMGKIYTKVNGTLFNSSFDFKKVGEVGYEHYEKYVPEIAKLTPNGVKFANYIYPSGDAFYIYCGSPTSGASYVVSNLTAITKNYYQDKNVAEGKDPTAPSMSTFTSGSGASRVWKEGQSGATYRAAFEAYAAKYLTDTCEPSRLAYQKAVEILSGTFGEDFKTAANLAYDTGIKFFNTGNVTVDEVNSVTDAISAVTEATASSTLATLLKSSLYVAAELTYKLGSADAYNKTVDAPTVYSNQISHSKKNVNTLVTDLQDVINNMYLNEFIAYIDTIDADNFTDEAAATAIEKYNKISEAFQNKLDAERKAKLITVATKHFVDYVNATDLNSITTDIQKTAYDKYQAMNRFKSEVPTEVYEKYVKIQAPIMNMDNFADDVENFKTADFIRPENSEVAWTTEGIQTAVDELWSLVVGIVIPMISEDIDLSDGLDSVLKDNLYQPEIVSAIFSLYAMLSHDETEIDVGMGGLTFPLGTIISWIVSDKILVDMLSADGDKYAGAIAKITAIRDTDLTEEEKAQGINKLDKIAATEFTASDFGFRSGNRSGFEDALLAVLRPITTLLAPDAKIKAMGFLSVDVNIKMFDYMNDGAYIQGVYANLLPLLEQIGMVDLPTENEYEANYYSVREADGTYIAADEFLRPVIDHLFTDVVDVVSPDPLNGLLKVLPRIGYVIGTNMINNTLQNVFPQMGVLSGLGSSLDLSADAINNMITGAPIDLSGLTGTECEIQLQPIDWMLLANCCTLESVPSSTDTNAYFLLRNGETDSAFSTVFYYIYDVLFADSQNYSAVKNLLITAAGEETASTIIGVTDGLVSAGSVDAYGQVLDLFGYPTGDPITKPDTPDNPDEPGDPDEPNNPSNPGTPGKPPTPDDSNNNSNSLNKVDTKAPSLNKANVKSPDIPKTGAQHIALAGITVATFATIALAVVLISSRKKVSDNR